MSTLKVHYEADFAARGGPLFDGPTTWEASADWVELAAIALVVLPGSPPDGPYRYGIIDPSGAIFADAADPAELLPWLQQYTESLRDEVDSSTDENKNYPVGEEFLCYLCKIMEGELRKCVGYGPVTNPADPTQTYKLECGHLAI
jgi:hypothetical protein